MDVALMNNQESGFFERFAPTSLILSSFFFFTLPLVLLSLVAPQWLEKTHLAAIYFVLIGGTHFCLTVGLYLQADHLEYFTSTKKTRMIYFGVPLFIFVAFAAYRMFDVAVVHPQFDRLFVATIRFFNFYHWGRQSFGVLQLFKRRAEQPFPAWLRKAENLYFYAILIPMMVTYLSGGNFAFTTSAWLLLPAGLLLCAILYGFARAGIAKANLKLLLFPILYFALQSISAVFTIYATAFYVFALAMHYIEYHVLMYPRCFENPKVEARGFIYLIKHNKLIFYACLLNFAVIANVLIATTGAVHGTKSAFVLALFDGLFVFHYFVESFVWRFSTPFYRKAVLPLYFSSRKSSTSETLPNRLAEQYG